MGIGLLGKVLTGEYAKKNPDMPGSSVVLQMEATEGDVERVELFHPAGLAGWPVKGGLVVMVPQGRGRVAVAYHDYRSTFTIAEGEVVLFSTDASGALISWVKMWADGKVEVANGATDLKTEIFALIDAVKAIVTVGSAATQTVNPASQAALEARKTNIGGLLK